MMEMEPAPAIRVADVSIELGHFYARTLAEGKAALTQRFAAIGELAATALEVRRRQTAHGLGLKPPSIEAQAISRPRVSTCFMFDDYHNRPRKGVSPALWLEEILGAARDAGTPIDYIAREAAYVESAENTLRILGKTGLVRTAEGSSWLVGTQPYSPRQPRTAMETNALARTSLLDAPRISVEICSHPKQPSQGTSWACPFLATQWQMHRLGISVPDSTFPQPTIVASPLPLWESWSDVPALLQLNPAAEPFAAENTYSVLPSGFLPVEGAVRHILGALCAATPQATDPTERIRYDFPAL